MGCETYDGAVAYYRVSTRQQGESGLGLEAQRTAVTRFAESECLTILDTFTEVETGTNKRQRPELSRAIAAAKANGAVLLIAKLDRLARNVHFVSGLMESGVKFVAVDMPYANEMTIHILAAVAQDEAQRISQRTKAALEAKRERDGEWRVSNLDDEARQRGAETMRQRAVEEYKSVAYTAGLLRQQGMSYREIADELNANGYRTRQGKEFHAMTVSRILDRATEEEMTA